MKPSVMNMPKKCAIDFIPWKKSALKKDLAKEQEKNKRKSLKKYKIRGHCWVEELYEG